MAKDPAFLFYPGDWLGGTMGMTFELKGCYLELLILQFQNKGRFTDASAKQVLGTCYAQAWPVLQHKFSTDGQFYFNERLLTEIEKRLEFSNSRRENALSKKKGKALAQHMEDGNEDENENKKENANEVIYPWPSENFKAAWAAWVEYKRLEHKQRYKDPKTEQTALKGLQRKANGDEPTAIAIITQSIENQWQGLFELKKTYGNGNNSNSKTGIDRANGAMESYLAKKMG